MVNINAKYVISLVFVIVSIFHMHIRFNGQFMMIRTVRPSVLSGT